MSSRRRSPCPPASPTPQVRAEAVTQVLLDASSFAAVYGSRPAASDTASRMSTYTGLPSAPWTHVRPSRRGGEHTPARAEADLHDRHLDAVGARTPVRREGRWKSERKRNRGAGVRRGETEENVVCGGWIGSAVFEEPIHPSFCGNILERCRPVPADVSTKHY